MAASRPVIKTESKCHSEICANIEKLCSYFSFSNYVAWNMFVGAIFMPPVSPLTTRRDVYQTIP